jgi:hypothetical protein
VEIVSETALWYSTGLPAVPLRWVLIRDPRGVFRTQAVLCTDLCVDPKQIEITVERNVLTIAGERRQEQTGEETGYHFSERRFGRFVRTLRLPAHVDADQVTARYEHGLLYIHLPKTEEARARRIEIQAGGMERQLTSSTD